MKQDNIENQRPLNQWMEGDVKTENLSRVEGGEKQKFVNTGKPMTNK